MNIGMNMMPKYKKLLRTMLVYMFFYVLFLIFMFCGNSVICFITSAIFFMGLWDFCEYVSNHETTFLEMFKRNWKRLFKKEK